MIKRSFFGFKKPVLEYDVLGSATPEKTTILPSETVQLFLDKAFDSLDSVILKSGDHVKTGQKLAVTRDDSIMSTVTGRVKEVSTYTGDFGRSYTSVMIDVAEKEETDPKFADIPAGQSFSDFEDYFACFPGKPGNSLHKAKENLKAIVILSMDDDLLTATRQVVLRENLSAVKNGIKILKKINGIEKIYMAVPQRLEQEAVSTGAEVITVNPCYPSANQTVIVEKIKGSTLPAGNTYEDEGFSLISVETVAALGNAVQNKKVPVDKTFTLIDKYGRQKIVSASIGTPLRHIFSQLYIMINENDRIIVGGPMTGAAVYSEDYPVCQDTDTVMVQDKSNVPFVSDNYCINCGECVRICPARIPVNVLVRFLEAGEYDEAADNYDLHSCIECGLCSLVCAARIPIFHYIRLAKYELSLMAPAEEDNV